MANKKEYIVWKNPFSQRDICIGLLARDGIGVNVLLATLYEDCFIWLFGQDAFEAIPESGNVRMFFFEAARKD